MRTILTLQSQVAAGHVGNSAAAFALRRTGHRVIELPTALLSNHNGWEHVAGLSVPPDTLQQMVAALADNGLLDRVDAVLTGYLTADLARVLPDIVATVQEHSPGALWCCDPVMGDREKGVYVPSEVVDELTGPISRMADVLVPNLFELGLLTGCRPTTLAEVTTAADRLAADGRGDTRTVVVTSVEVSDLPSTRVHMVGCRPGEHWLVGSPRLDRHFNGSGDLTAALLLGRLLEGQDLPTALAETSAAVAAVLARTAAEGDPELSLVSAQDELAEPSGVAARRVRLSR